MPLILTDDDLPVFADMRHAIAAIETAFRARAAGAFVAPPRHHVAFPGPVAEEAGRLTFTIGGDERVAGFRVYDTFGGADEQIVAVWAAAAEEAPRNLLGLILGTRLGEIRTGAIGGLAIDRMAASDAGILGIIGSGPQARSQLEAATAVRPLRDIRVFSRSEDNRRRFAAEMSAELDLPVMPVESAQAAVAGAGIVVCATPSHVPVLQAEWLSPGVHINSLGPKTRRHHEIGVDIAAIARIIATDSPQQCDALDAPFFLDGTPHRQRLIDLADLVAGHKPARRAPDDITLFCSVGLAGTEVLVAEDILRRAQTRRRS